MLTSTVVSRPPLPIKLEMSDLFEGRLEELIHLDVQSHPSYSASDADLVFISSDDVIFRAHSCILKQASEVFDDMLSLPLHCPNSDLIRLSETSELVKLLFDAIYPSPGLPDDLSYESLREIALTARKYDVPGALHRVRRAAFSMSLVPGPPCLDRYGLACEFGWEREAKIASTGTLALNLRCSETLQRLQRLECSSVLKLQELHRIRKEQLDEDLRGYNKPGIWNKIHPRPDRFGFFGNFCPGYKDLFDSTPWILLRYMIRHEMDKCSRGDFLMNGFWLRPELKDLWTLNCRTCQEPLIGSKVTFVSLVADLVKSLPETI